MLSTVKIDKNDFERILYDSSSLKETIKQYRNYKENSRYYKVSDIIKIIPESKNAFLYGFYDYIPEHTNVRVDRTSVSSGGFNGISKQTTYYENYFYIGYVCYKKLESEIRSCFCFDCEILKHEHLGSGFPYIHNNPRGLSIKNIQKQKYAYITVPQSVYKELDKLKVPYITESRIRQYIDKNIKAEHMLIYYTN